MILINSVHNNCPSAIKTSKDVQTKNVFNVKRTST